MSPLENVSKWTGFSQLWTSYSFTHLVTFYKGDILAYCLRLNIFFGFFSVSLRTKYLRCEISTNKKQSISYNNVEMSSTPFIFAMAPCCIGVQIIIGF
jgi:hypothetical protein